jgi:hypothetical protein
MVTPAVNSIMSYSGHKKNYRVRFPSLLLNQNKHMKLALKYTYSLFQYSVLLLTYTGTLLIVYSMLDMVYSILFN